MTDEQKNKKLGREEIVFNSTICLFLSKVKYSRGSRVTGPFQDFPPGLHPEEFRTRMYLIVINSTLYQAMLKENVSSCPEVF